VAGGSGVKVGAFSVRIRSGGAVGIKSVLVGVRLGVKVADGVKVLEGVRVGVGVAVCVADGVSVGVGVSVDVCDGVKVAVGVGVNVGEGVFVAVEEGVAVRLGVRDGVIVAVKVGVGVSVGVKVAVTVAGAVSDGSESVTVSKDGVAVGPCATRVWAAAVLARAVWVKKVARMTLVACTAAKVWATAGGVTVATGPESVAGVIVVASAKGVAVFGAAPAVPVRSAGWTANVEARAVAMLRVDSAARVSVTARAVSGGKVAGAATVTAVSGRGVGVSAGVFCPMMAVRPLVGVAVWAKRPVWLTVSTKPKIRARANVPTAIRATTTSLPASRRGILCLFPCI
jgi:hypothetical protein